MSPIKCFQAPLFVVPPTILEKVMLWTHYYSTVPPPLCGIFQVMVQKQYSCPSWYKSFLMESIEGFTKLMKFLLWQEQKKKIIRCIISYFPNTVYPNNCKRCNLLLGHKTTFFFNHLSDGHKLHFIVITASTTFQVMYCHVLSVSWITWYIALELK